MDPLRINPDQQLNKNEIASILKSGVFRGYGYAKLVKELSRNPNQKIFIDRDKGAITLKRDFKDDLTIKLYTGIPQESKNPIKNLMHRLTVNHYGNLEAKVEEASSIISNKINKQNAKVLELKNQLNSASSDTEKGKIEYTLGRHYQQDEKNVTLATKYFLDATQHGDKDAPYVLASIYEKSTDPSLKKQANKYFEIAADNGNIYAQFETGKNLLTLGYDPATLQKSIDYFTKASSAGHLEAQKALPNAEFQLARSLDLFGNTSEAVDHYIVAAKLGNKGAARALERLATEKDKLARRFQELNEIENANKNYALASKAREALKEIKH